MNTKVITVADLEAESTHYGSGSRQEQALYLAPDEVAVLLDIGGHAYQDVDDTQKAALDNALDKLSRLEDNR